MSENTVTRLFDGDVECSRLEHAVHWVREHRPSDGGKWPSRERVVRGVRSRWKLRISDRLARTAIEAVRKEGENGLDKNR